MKDPHHHGVTGDIIKGRTRLLLERIHGHQSLRRLRSRKRTYSPSAVVQRLVRDGLRLYEQGREAGAMEERHRIARELHDDLAQRLGTLCTRLAALETKPAVAKLRDELACIKQLAEEAYEGTRAAISKTQNRVPNGLGFITLIRAYLHEFGHQTQIGTELNIVDQRAMRFSPHARRQLIGILKEALSNARKHAKPGHVAVTFAMEGNFAKVTIEDDGCGFRPEDQMGVQSSLRGLGIMRERAAMASGMLGIESFPGKGTTITLKLPTLAHPRIVD